MTPPDRSPPTRRDFLASGTTLALGAIAWPALPRRADHALVLRGGTVIDGTGGPPRVADVAIDDGRIAAIAPQLSTRGREEIPCRDLVVAPGFIDIHSHADGSLWADPRLESVIRQGITTVVVGQDGSSRATGVPGPADDAAAGRTTTMAELFRAIDRARPSANVASMIGLGSVRGAVVGLDDRPATASEIARMTALVAQALAEGACGASSGLEYTPGAFARTDELIAVCAPLAAPQLPYATHMRNEDDELLEALRESVAVARGARCPLQVAHLKTQGPRNWGKLDAAFALIAEARASGMDVTFDRYPYIAYQTGLTNLFPVWSRDGGVDAFFARLRDPAVADRIRRDTLAKVALIGGWENVMIANVSRAEDRSAEGQRLGTYAVARGVEPYQLAVQLLEANRANVGMVGFAMSEENLERILAHPQAMVCSDGGAFAIEGPTRRGHPHPRGIGSFPRVLGRYVRERRVLTLPDAIAKLSARPAARLRLADRGRLAVGLAADVTVFDPDTVADRATFEAPYQYPAGLRCVVVNGTVVLRDEARVGEGSGRAVRPG